MTGPAVASLNSCARPRPVTRVDKPNYFALTEAIFRLPRRRLPHVTRRDLTRPAPTPNLIAPPPHILYTPPSKAP